MFIENLKFLEAAAFTVISFGLPSTYLDQPLKTGDVYKVNVLNSTPVQNKFLPVKTATMPAAFIGSVAPTVTTWGMWQQAIGDVHRAFDEVGINRVVGDQLISLAKGVLAEMNHPSIKVIPSLVIDPEENATYLTICLHVNTTFEESLALDSKLTRELVDRADNMPENLSFAVYDIG